MRKASHWWGFCIAMCDNASRLISPRFRPAKNCLIAPALRDICMDWIVSALFGFWKTCRSSIAGQQKDHWISCRKPKETIGWIICECSPYCNQFQAMRTALWGPNEDSVSTLKWSKWTIYLMLEHESNTWQSNVAQGCTERSLHTFIWEIMCRLVNGYTFVTFSLVG